MNKVISTNIGGMIFNLEEDAYTELSKYLEQLKNKLSKVESGDEILQDIELRIAELFNNKQTDFKKVILLKEVEEVMLLMGNPAEYLDENNIEEEQESVKSENTSSNEQDKENKRVFYRNPDDGVIAGVCAGISSYFNMEVTLVRLIFVLLAFFFGFAFPLYIILWIIVPKALTSADKLKMKGEPITVETIKKEVMEASERIKNSSFTQEAKSKITETVKKASGIIIRIKQFFGIGILAFAVFSLFFFSLFIISDYGIFFSEGEGIYSFTEFSKLFFISSMQAFLGWIGFLFFFLVPLLGLILLGLRWLFRLNKKWTRPISLSFFILWLGGTACLVVVGLQIGHDFTNEAEVKIDVANVKLDELVVSISDGENHPKNVKLNGFSMNQLLKADKNNIKSNQIELKVEKSNDSLVHIFYQKVAYGKTDEKALERANNIKSKITFSGNKLNLISAIEYSLAEKFRGQMLVVYIYLPETTNIKWQADNRLLNQIKQHGTYFHFSENTFRIACD